MDEFLKEAMRERGWNIPRLAEACDKNPGLVARWLSPNPRYRVMPGPESCQKIAEALAIDSDYLLELAGHRKPRNGHVPVEPVDLRRARLDSLWHTLDDLVQTIIVEIAERHSNGNVIQPYGPILAHLVVAA